MKVEIAEVILFFIVLPVTILFILGATYFAIWLRTKIIFSPVGKFLVKLGLGSANGTVNDLVEGRLYIVKQDFVDYFCSHFKTGERLTFQKHFYLPYHGGHTLQFAEATISLQEERQAEILHYIWKYLEPAASAAATATTATAR